MNPKKFRSPHTFRKPLRYRLSVASRALAAMLGGYALASAIATLCALTLPLPHEEAILAGVMASYLVYPVAVLWVFTASTAWRAWLGILAPGLATGSVVWWIMHGVPG